MKKHLKNITIALFIILAGISLFGCVANAQSASPSGDGAPSTNTQTNNVSLWGMTVLNAVNTVLAIVVNAALSAAGVLVSIAAALLNVSIVVTLHIKEFVASTPAIYTLWRTLRDLSGIFFIFLLLWEAIKMILGMNNGYGKLLKDIVMAGILINFSFFFTSVLIDASNVISQAIYNSMIPTNASLNITAQTSLRDIASAATGYNPKTGAVDNSAPGISNIFMNSLKIQSLYDTSGNKVGTAIGNPFKIVLIGIVGIIIMITTALSFALAAAAFITRLVILVFLLAFSPLWAVGMIIPDVKSEFPFWKHLSSQLIFMPVYLLLMYAALSILNNSQIMGAAVATTASFDNGTNWMFSYVVIAINFAMVIIMLNLPLTVGLKMGGMASGWMSKAMSKVNADKIWRSVGGSVSGVVGRNTIGKWSSSVDKSLSNTRIGNTMIARDLRGVTTGALASSKYGSSRSYGDVQKIQKDITKKGGEIKKTSEFHNALSAVTTSGSAANRLALKDSIKNLNEKERLALGDKVLMDKNVVQHLKKSEFEAIKKSDDFTDEEKEKIVNARYKALEDAVTAGDTDTIKFMIDNMEAKDLGKLIGTPGAPGNITNPNVIRHLKPSQLTALADDGLDASIKHAIGNVIRGDTTMKTYGWMTSGDRPTIWA